LDAFLDYLKTRVGNEELESYVCLKDAATLTMFLDARSKDFVALLLFDKTEEAMLN
jgi:hypothetical protein